MTDEARAGRATRIRTSPPRDQATSSITLILEDLFRATPTARAVVLVDYEGETVDYAGLIEPFDLKVTAAHFRIVLSELAETRAHGEIKKLTVRARTRAYYIHQLTPEYALVVVLHRDAAYAVSERAMHHAAGRLAEEAGWAPPEGLRWHSVRVDTAQGDVGRPSRLFVGGQWRDLDVMGAMVGLGLREKGFRVRVIATGHELLLVRERLGRWFADERIA